MNDEAQSGEGSRGAAKAARPSRLARFLEPFKALRPRALPTLKYLTQTEVHTYAFSVAANAILSFFPFVVLLMTVIRKVFPVAATRRMLDAIRQLLKLYLPTNPRAQSFIVEKLSSARGGTQFVSLVMLVVSSTGVFLPLEVALNEVWGIKKNRSYLSNQIISLGLAIAVGVLAIFSVAMAAISHLLLQTLFFGFVANFLFKAFAWVLMKGFGFGASVTAFFLIYWLLPNGKVPRRDVLPAAVVTGLLLEIAKYVYIALLPTLDFGETYGPFSLSVTLIFWAFVSGLLMLGGARLSAPIAEPEPAAPGRPPERQG
jgi:membrane protein